MRHVLAPGVVADRQPLGHVLRHGAEALRDALADRLQRLVPGAPQRRMEAHALGRAMIDGDKDRDLPMLGGEGRCHVRAPHRVAPFSGMMVPS